MMSFGSRYEPGTRVQYRTGYTYVKTKEKMIAESRFNWEQHKGELKPGDRVFHLDGDRTNNRISNLAKVHFNDTKFVMLKKSRLLWSPTIKTIDKKSGKLLVNS
jgi:hypothetical protein